MLSTFSTNLKIRLVSSFISRIVNSSISPFIALFIASRSGVALAGIFLIGQTILGYISNLVGGYIGDRFNESKILFYGQMIQSFFLALLSLGISTKLSNYYVLSIYLLNVIAGNIYKSTFNSLLISETNNKNKKLAFTLDYLSLNLSLAVGIIIGGLGFISNESLFFAISSITTFLIGMFIKLRFKYPVREFNKADSNVSQQSVSFWKNYKKPLTDSLFVMYTLGLNLVGAVSLTIANAYLIILKNNFNFVSFNFLQHNIRFKVMSFYSFLQVENIIIVVLLTLSSYKLFKNFSTKTKIIYSSLLLTISYSLLILNQNVYVVVLLILIGSLMEIIFVPEAQAIQILVIPIENKATYSAVLSLGNNLAQSFAAGAITLLSLGNLTSFIYTLFMGVLGSILLLKAYIKSNRKNTIV